MASYSKLLFATIAILMVSSCATGTRSNSSGEESTFIENPFGGFHAKANGENQSITFRTKKGDQAIEVEVPQDQTSEYAVPFNQKFSSKSGSTAEMTGADGVDRMYSKQKPTVADHEIASTFLNPANGANEAQKREIESSLGLQESDEMPNMDESYLAKVDVVKQLFKAGRYEASLIETDRMIKDFPTNGRLYEMRGTLLDRLGYGDLALRSWKQALEFQPSRLSLRKMIEKREQQRSVASEKRQGN